MTELLAGARYMLRGQRWVLRHPRWLGFGLLPALIALVLYAAALAALALYAGDLVSWATPFADDWSPGRRSVLRTTLAVLAFGGGLALAALTFTAVTLLIGDPFYEALSGRVEEDEGGAPDGPDLPLWRELWRSLRDSLYVLMCALACAVPLFLLGFVPGLGQTVVPVAGVAVSGFFLTAELTSVALQRRGVPVRARLRLLRGRLPLVLGFGVPLALAFLVPLAAVPLMPGAVAGATLLARDLHAARAASPSSPPPSPYDWNTAD